MNKIFILLISALVAGCWAAPDVPVQPGRTLDWSQVSEAESDSVFATVASLDRSHFYEAWGRLHDVSYRRRHIAAVRDDSGKEVGRIVREVVISGPADQRSVRIEHVDSSGAFDRSFWTEFAPNQTASDEPDWAVLALPEDPLFLTEQGPAFFRYAAVTDTVINATRLKRYAIGVRPESPRQGLQQAILLVQDSVLLGVDVLVSQRSFLYQEVSRVSIGLRKSPGGQWYPERASASSTVGLPFSRSRRYSIETEYTPVEWSPRDRG